MSDNSEEKGQNDKEDNVCRDFIRGICDRRYCKYKHETDMKTLNFCHDYQNNICPRPTCKFIHCTPEEEFEYKNTGVMSNHILAEATRKNQLPGAQPICNQFRKGLCRRSFCKYRHLTREEEDAEIMELIQHNNKKNLICINNPLTESQVMNTPSNGLHRRNPISYDEYEDCGLQLPKRRFIAEPEILTNGGELHSVEPNRVRAVFKGYFAGNPPPPMLSRVDARTLMLEEENNMLHKEIAQLKRQVSDLTATNEFLLDQNANLRVSNKRNEGVSMPAVTITNTNTPQVIRTVTASVATVPVSLATVSTCNPVSVSIAGVPTVSMAPPAQILAPSQQILVTTNPSTQAQLAIAQQNLANNLAQQAQPQLTSQAQLALATTTQQLTLANTQQAQQLANQQQQLANQQLTSLANTSQAQLAQQLLTQNQQIEMHRNAINTSQVNAMSNTTQPMVSYPIMTQSINHALTH
ncbi:zinc finger CCCH domain-containing protein 10-like isoform X1 [Tribolium madens]|uniref:zinc finger CCCH domain-containing protein 10-like isoform X1 n=2 Tax=Tribolium madens TaxID=41895 RepID=UPI001CF72519|nr:zinc finger CCCH domain-containing protein 10-like isoform X1 [Tribolium madens]XP_044266761.1 zinc finger CCCH domain-containing protein 10-like isoform X1 [Tribolium madens]